MIKYRQLGNTELHVSHIGFGGATLGNAYGVLDDRTGERAVHAAIAHGINYFDTSPYYGRTLGEMRLGAALQDRRQKVILATKGGRYGNRDFDMSAGGLRRSLEASLTHLKTDVIDLYQLHDIEFVREQQIVEESLPALAALRDEGKIRYIGITGYSLKMLDRVARQFAVDAVLTYCRYNLMTQTLLDSPLYDYVQQQDIGLINASALHMGVLRDGSPALSPLHHPAPQAVLDAGLDAARVAAEHNVSLAELALEFAFQNKEIDTTLVGMRTEEEVHQNVGVGRNRPNPAALAAIRHVLEPVRHIIWQSGLSENSDEGAVPSH